MINAIDDLVLLTTPLFLVLIVLIFLFLFLEWFFHTHGIFQILSLVLVLVMIVLSFFYDVKYQELVFVLLFVGLSELIFLKITSIGEEKK